MFNTLMLPRIGTTVALRVVMPRLGEDNEMYLQQCAPQKNTELWGDVVKWGAENLQV